MEFLNPFKPGAGHAPPYLAGREDVILEFQDLLKQEVILENLVLTGLRGVGKTVLLDKLKPLAVEAGWYWAGSEFSESSSLSEERIATRILADLATITSSWTVRQEEVVEFGFAGQEKTVDVKLSYELLKACYDQTPGLVSDKLKAVLELTADCMKPVNTKGLIFAYDEAQNLADHAGKNEYPLSLLLDVFQSIQKKNIPMMLVLAGLPTLFPKLVDARTFAERMFHVIFLKRLTDVASREAITKPIEQAGCPYPLSEELISSIIQSSGGYPYFLQYFCKEVYDVAVQRHSVSEPLAVSLHDITRKLDHDFFDGRWARTTDRQRDLLRVISQLENCDDEFTVKKIVEKSVEISVGEFKSSHVNQMLSKLSENGIIFKNRHGKYSFAVPLLGQFISRQESL